MMKELEEFKVCLQVMKEAEKLIGEEGLHDKWHNEGTDHRAFHDLLYKRIRGEEALATISDTTRQITELLKDLRRYVETGKYDHEYGYPRRIEDMLSKLGIKE